ncbi:MAG: L,D-transpeptidase family protein [Bacteroidia bacterium]
MTKSCNFLAFLNDKKTIFLLFLVLIFSYESYAQVPKSSLSKLAVTRNKTELQNELLQMKLEFGNQVFIRIYKQSNELEIWIKKEQAFALFKTYKICYYSGELGTKTKVGDGQAPEGIYKVFPNQMNPFSSYHLSFNIGYPNNFDQANGFTGSSIMIHGNCVSIGCFAMTNPIIEQIWTLMEAAFNQKQTFINVFIFPFKFENIDLNNYKNNSNYMFWKQLEPIDLAFNKSHKIPNVKVQNKKYVIVNQ